MKLHEVLESANITHDDKARRVLNTAPDKYADISLKEIQQGITIERLEALTVPVYQYGHQITIHGIFRDIPDDLVVAGYKSVFSNGNGSLGVKYVAIDGGKKVLLTRVADFSKKHWHIFTTSQGCMATRVFISADHDNDKKRAIECYQSTPDNLYAGAKEIGALMWGGYGVLIHIGAIYESNLWQLIKELTGIESEAEYNALKKQADDDWNVKQAEYDAERKAKAEADKIIRDKAIANFKAPDNWQLFKGKIEKIGTYARIYDTYNSGLALQVIKVVKRGAFLCSNTKNFIDFKFIDWQPDKYHKCGYGTIDGWLIQDSVKTAPNKPKSKPMATVDSEVKGDISIVHKLKMVLKYPSTISLITQQLIS
jgi:hypothetical protein